MRNIVTYVRSRKYNEMFNHPLPRMNTFQRAFDLYIIMKISTKKITDYELF